MKRTIENATLLFNLDVIGLHCGRANQPAAYPVDGSSSALGIR